MKSRAPWATCLVIVFVVVACQSVHTQGGPAVESDPSALQNGAAPETVPNPAPATPTPTAKPRQHSYTAVEVDGPYIAITFDDGPHAKLTPELLDLLKARGIAATFFVVGQNAAEYPDILKRMDAEGHEIGNHSWNHPALSRLGPDAVKGQIDRTDAAVMRAVGKKTVVMRPPYGATNARLDRRMDEEFGEKVILWSVDPQDWRYRNATRVAQHILANTQAGGIILAHDIHPSTIAAMPATLDGLLAKGFKFVTVSQLLAMEKGRVEAAVPVEPAAAPTATPFTINRVEPLDAQP